jgi:galactose mutarotase-like enzyme
VTRHRGDDSEFELRSEMMVVRCRPEWGFLITALEDPTSGVNALWARRGHEPADFVRSLPQPGEASVDAFLDHFVGGWFEMFPAAGHPGVVDGRPTLLHGEVAVLPWTVRSAGPTHVEASVSTLRSSFVVTRRLEVADDGLTLSATIANLGGEPAPYAWGFHPCFDRAVFAGGRIDAQVASASVPGPSFDPANATLAADQQFTWPHVRRGDGSTLDLGVVPSAPDGRHDHTCLTLANGRIRISAPAVDRTFTLEVETGVFPAILLWQDFLAPGASFGGTADVFTLEPATYLGRSMDDAVATGAVRTLAPGEHVSTTIRAAWSVGGLDA